MNYKITNILSSCNGCAACYNACPEKAIKMLEDKEGFLYPAIDIAKCTECFKCEKLCPELSSSNYTDKKLIKKAYYGWHSDESIRKKSSSGGIFTALAEFVLKNNGVVFGAVFDKMENAVIHRSTDETDLDFMRKSKYVQSYIGESFSNAKQILDTGRYVLFTGTPCQLDGLQCFLRKDYENLISFDFICHGVPPMRLLKENLALYEKKYRLKIIGFDFRPKIERWAFDYFVIFVVSGLNVNELHKTIKIPWEFDPYFSGFIKNLTLRKSCYKCKYSPKQHSTDITVADFWGYRYYDEKILDERGLSLIMANTKKGDVLLNKLSIKDVVLNSIDWKYAEYAIKPKSSITYNLEKRNGFFSDYLKYGYNNAIKLHSLKPSIWVVARRKIGNIINKYGFSLMLKKKIRKILSYKIIQLVIIY